MMRSFISLLLVLAFTTSVQAQEDPSKDPRNRLEHFNPTATLSDDTLQWLMIHRLVRTLHPDKQVALGKIQLAYEKQLREFSQKHAGEVDAIVAAFGNSVRMPAPQREKLMRQFMLLVDHLPDDAAFQKQVAQVLSMEEAGSLIKLLRERRQERLGLMGLSPLVIDELEIPVASREKIKSVTDPVIAKAYPYRSTLENVDQWIREQATINKTDEAAIERVRQWSMHRRLQVINEALLSLRVDLPKDDFAKFESFLREYGRWQAQSLERIAQPAPEAAPPDVPAAQRDPLLDPMQFNSLATVMRDYLEWFEIQKKNRSLPVDKVHKIEAMITELLNQRIAFEDKHRTAYNDIINTYGPRPTFDKPVRQELVDKLFAFHDQLPLSGKFNHQLMTLVTYQEGAPLITLLRIRRQMRIGVLEGTAAVLKDLPVPTASMKIIEAELQRAARNNEPRKKVFGQLTRWNIERDKPPAGTVEASRASSRVAGQSNWLLQEMVNEIDQAIVALQKALPAEDFAKFEARAMLVGGIHTAGLDPKPKPAPATTPTK